MRVVWACAQQVHRSTCVVQRRQCTVCVMPVVHQKSEIRRRGVGDTEQRRSFNGAVTMVNQY